MSINDLYEGEFAHERRVLSGEYYSNTKEQNTDSDNNGNFKEEDFFGQWDERLDEIESSFIQSQQLYERLSSAYGYIELDTLSNEVKISNEIKQIKDMQKLESLPAIDNGYELDPVYYENASDDGEQDYQIQLEDAISRQAEPILDEFLLTELMPPTAARVIEKSSKRSQTDPIALAMHLNAAIGGLLGSKIRVDTLYGSGIAIPSNLYVWFFSITYEVYSWR